MTRAQPAPGRRYVLARPEHVRDIVRVGDIYLVPLFDGVVGDVVGPLRDAGPARIPPHRTEVGSVTIVSQRARALRVVATGEATILVDLVAAAYRRTCLSCRAIHYFVTVNR